MEISKKLLAQVELDLGLNQPFIKGQTITVKNCWHFYTDGKTVEEMYYDESDFIDGMNRIYVVCSKYKVIILAFVLMDTHVHFILYGEYSECNRFMHDYVQRTSRYFFLKYKENNKLSEITISHQKIGTDAYLKTAICYTLRNPTIGGIRCMPQTYPWSSGALYFASDCPVWSRPSWVESLKTAETLGSKGVRQIRNLTKSRYHLATDVRVINGMIFPGDYVAYTLVERIFKSIKSFNYFMGQNKEEEIEARGGSISNLLLPMQEMRQHKNEMCLSMFGCKTVKTLDTWQRVRLAKALKSKYNSSLKQICRLCGISYSEVADLI